MKTKFTEVVLLTKSYNLQDFKDWLHWHLDIIGFDHCHVFDNESSVDIKSVCDSYGDKVTYELIKGWPDQYSLYNRYINNESPAWWVLPIDDDEFLYVGDKFNNDINTMMLTLKKQYPEMKKLSMCWRNMFPLSYIKNRTKSLIENATGWSNDVCQLLRANADWRQDNRWFKTIVFNTGDLHWGLPFNSGHEPTHGSKNFDTYFIDGYKQCNDKGWILPPKNSDDLFIAHYQYKSDEEWQMKCTKRISAANKTFNKNKPLVYKKIYDYKEHFKNCDLLYKIWNK